MSAAQCERGVTHQQPRRVRHARVAAQHVLGENADEQHDDEKEEGVDRFDFVRADRARGGGGLGQEAGGGEHDDEFLALGGR